MVELPQFYEASKSCSLTRLRVQGLGLRIAAKNPFVEVTSESHVHPHCYTDGATHYTEPRSTEVLRLWAHLDTF